MHLPSHCTKKATPMSVERKVATLRGPTWQKERGPTKVAWSRSFSGTCRGEMSSESR